MTKRRMTAAGPGAPAVGRASGPLGRAQDADREIARQTALRARAVAEFAALRPASADRPPGLPGAMSQERRAARSEVLADVSEWAGQELVVALSITDRSANALLERSMTLVHRLPRTLAALEAGVLHPGHVWPMLDTVAPIAGAHERASAEAELIAWVSGRSVTTPAQLGAKARRVVLVHDARAAARRLDAALRQRGVFVRPDEADGMAVLSALLTVPEAQALIEALGGYADALDDGPDDHRTRGQKMADCLLDLVLRPMETDVPAVQAQLTIVASVETLAGGDQAGEVDGQPVPAEMVRALARGLGLIPDRAAAADAAASVPQASRSVPAAAPPVERLEPAPAPVAGDLPLEEWWAQVEAEVQAEWGCEPDPPPEELLRRWECEAWLDQLPAASDVLDPGRNPHLDQALQLCHSDLPAQREAAPEAAGSAAVARPDLVAAPCAVADPADDADVGSPWAAADRAVDEAGAVLLDFQRALGRARTAVRRAETADVADEAVWARSDAARMTAAAESLEALAAAGAEQRAILAGLLGTTGGGGLVDRPRIAVCEALTGALLALTDSRELRRAAHAGTGLGPPPDTSGYRPGARLDRFLRSRDRRCRFPGCRAPVPRRGELDHGRPWPDGPTSAANLAGYCTPHHRGKHQAPGWQHDLTADGTLTVTTPTGLVAVTTPPPF